MGSKDLSVAQKAAAFDALVRIARQRHTDHVVVCFDREHRDWTLEVKRIDSGMNDFTEGDTLAAALSKVALRPARGGEEGKT